MKTLLIVLATLFLFALLVVGIGSLVPLSELAERVNQDIDHYGGVEFLAREPLSAFTEDLVDLFNESGFGVMPLDPEDPLLKRRIVLIAEGMNERTARRVVESLVYLDAEDPDTPIDLRLVTGGGWTDSAFTIVDTMRAIHAPVNVTALSGCYSAGTVILAAGTGTRTATPNTILSVHVNELQPDEDEGLGEHDYKRHELARFRGVYERFTSVPKAWFDEPGDNQYYLDAEQALQMELIDAIAEPHWKAPVVEPTEEPADVEALKAA